MKNNRRTIRLKDYDYASEGAYFVTVCTRDRQQSLGEIQKGQMHLSESGEIVDYVWNDTPFVRPNVELGEFVIMPDHLHGIVIIKWRDPEIIEVPFREYPVLAKGDLPFRLMPRSPSCTIGAIIRGVKGSATTQINQMYETYGTPFWQRNYYEHIIRNGREFELISRYIRENPENWPW